MLTGGVEITGRVDGMKENLLKGFIVRWFSVEEKPFSYRYYRFKLIFLLLPIPDCADKNFKALTILKTR